MNYWKEFGEVSTDLYSRIFRAIDSKNRYINPVVMSTLIVVSIILEIIGLHRILIYILSVLPITYFVLIIPSAIKYYIIKDRNNILKIEFKSREQLEEEVEKLRNIRSSIIDERSGKIGGRSSKKNKSKYKKGSNRLRCVKCDNLKKFKVSDDSIVNLISNAVDEYGDEVFKKYHIKGWSNIWLSKIYCMDKPNNTGFTKYLDTIELYKTDNVNGYNRMLFDGFASQCLNYYDDDCISRLLAYEFMSRIENKKITYILLNILILDYENQIKCIDSEEIGDSDYVNYIDLNVLMSNRNLKELTKDKEMN